MYSPAVLTPISSVPSMVAARWGETGTMHVVPFISSPARRLAGALDPCPDLCPLRGRRLEHPSRATRVGRSIPRAPILSDWTCCGALSSTARGRFSRAPSVSHWTTIGSSQRTGILTTLLHASGLAARSSAAASWIGQPTDAFNTTTRVRPLERFAPHERRHPSAPLAAKLLRAASSGSRDSGSIEHGNPARAIH